MYRLRSFFAIFLTVLVLYSWSIVSVSAKNTADMGFVEYQTEASINFEEIIEVVLTNHDSGHYYTQRLYRINDYNANVSVPVGVYSVMARVINDSEDTLAGYTVICLTDEVEVKNLHSATVISLRVDQFTCGDVSGGATSYVAPDEETFSSDHPVFDTTGEETFERYPLWK